MLDHPPDLDEYRSVEELQHLRHDVHDAMLSLEREHNGTPFDADARSKFVGLKRTTKEIDERIAELRGRQQALLDQYRRNPNAVEAGTDFSYRLSGDAPVDRSQPRHVIEARESGLRALDTKAGVLSNHAGSTLEQLIRHADRSGVEARYLAAVADPSYFSAFGKLLTDPTTGHLRLEPREVEAVRVVNRVMQERAMSLTGASGGFAVPFELDPTVLLTSNGALNPVRQLARVIAISVDQWKGVSSAGVTATYQAEAAAVTDASPALAQPTIDCAMARCFVPFSIELGQDWGALQTELGRLIADARDVLDATQFLSGTGTDSPAGVLTGLSTSQRVQTAGVGAIAIGDIYSLKGALPARFIPNATWAAHPNRLDSVFRLTPSGSTTEPQAMPTRDGALVGKPVVEWTTMATASTTGTKWALYGDFRAGFTIADRVGMSLELVPHLFGAAQGQLPTGQRGVFGYWRTGSKVVIPEALRYGEVL